MSFLDQLKKRKNQLKQTETVVTKTDGQRYVEKGQNIKILQPNKFGFVIDTKPDDTPVLIVDHMYIGSQDCATTSVLNSYNIKHVLSLGIKVDLDVNSKFVDCLDLPETVISDILKESLPFIHKVVENKENILIHCNAGVSRTSMVAIGYLMHYLNMNFEDAYSLVKEKRPAIQPNVGFKKQLKNSLPGKLIDILSDDF